MFDNVCSLFYTFSYKGVGTDESTGSQSTNGGGNPIFPLVRPKLFPKKSGDQYSSITLYEYAKEYRRFLNWLIQEGFSSAEELSEITLAEFAALWPEDLEFYKAHLVKAPKILKESTKSV